MIPIMTPIEMQAAAEILADAGYFELAILVIREVTRYDHYEALAWGAFWSRTSDNEPTSFACECLERLKAHGIVVVTECMRILGKAEKRLERERKENACI